MFWNKNRFFAFWASHESRAHFLGLAALALGVLLFMSETARLKALNEEPVVIRVDCDGVAQRIQINEDAVEPQEREIRAFTAQFAVFFMRADSMSVANDALWSRKRMTSKLGESYATAMRERGIETVESLQRRTEIRPEDLEIVVDQESDPWRVEIKGTRRLFLEEGIQEQPFELGLDLVRISRNETIGGLLVSDVRPGGERVPMEADLARAFR